jgi:predicted GTPase
MYGMRGCSSPPPPPTASPLGRANTSDRAGLAEDLDAAQGYDVLLTELKAAAVDIGVERALARGAEVVFVDNRAVVVQGSADLDTALGAVIDLARARGAHRGINQ